MINAIIINKYMVNGNYQREFGQRELCQRKYGQEYRLPNGIWTENIQIYKKYQVDLEGGSGRIKL